MFGITNTFATIPGMVAPIVAGALTPNVSKLERCQRQTSLICTVIAVQKLTAHTTNNLM